MSNPTPTIARFKIGKKTYTTASLDEITLAQLMVFNTQAEDMGLRLTFAEIEKATTEIADLTTDGKTDEVEKHRHLLVVIGATIWAARRTAGENVTLEEATSFPMKDLEFLPSAQDHKPAGPTKRAAKKPAPRAAAAVAAAQ